MNHKIFQLITILFLNISINSKEIHKAEQIDPDINRSKLMKMSCGFLLSKAIQVFAQLKIADELKTPQEINDAFSQKFNLKNDMLYRLLRMLSGHGIVKQENNKFGLTEIGQYLCSDHPNTLANFLTMEGNLTRWNSYSLLDKTLKTGKPGFDILYNQNYFDYIKNKPEDQVEFNKGMEDISNQENKSIANFFKQTLKSESIVDIGGGTGDLILNIRSELNNMNELTLFDYTTINETILKDLKSKNIEFKQGSFLQDNQIPKGKDIYLLKRILHDWDNENSINILKQCYNVMNLNSKLFIIDSVIPNDNNYHISKDIDFEMMVLFGGKERSHSEFEEVIKAAGLKLKQIISLENSMLSILEISK